MYTMVLVSGDVDDDTRLLLERHLPREVCRTAVTDSGVTCWFFPVGTRVDLIEEFEKARPVLGDRFGMLREIGMQLAYVRMPNLVAQIHLIYAYGPDARYNTFVVGRRCGKCHYYYGVVEFNKHATSAEGFQSWCRRCSSQLGHKPKREDVDG